jgi:hypothetical protein
VLLLPVSNYHAAQNTVQAQTVEARVEEEPRTFERFDWRFRSHAEVEPVQLPEEFTENRDSHDFEEDHTPSREFLVPPEITEGVLPLVEMVVPEEWTDEEQLRVLRRRAERLMEEIRKLRLEQELDEGRQSLSDAFSQ